MNAMKKSLGIIIGLILVACSGESTTDENIEIISEDSSSAETVEEIEDYAEVETNYEEPEEGHVWQINNYVEYLLNAKVFDDPEEMDYEAGDMWYYERLNINGGYARVTGAIEGNMEFGLWRMDNGHDLIGKTSMGCGPVCDYSYTFYELDKNKGGEVSEDILPMKSIEEHQAKVYKLVIEKYPDLEYPDDQQLRLFIPQGGTSMKVNLVVGADEVEVPLLKLAWDKQRFFVEALYENVPDLN